MTGFFLDFFSFNGGRGNKIGLKLGYQEIVRCGQHDDR